MSTPTIRAALDAAEQHATAEVWAGHPLAIILEALIKQTRAALASEPVGEGSILQWTDNKPPCEECRYDHCTAETPFGRFLISWESWKQFDSPTIDETPWGGWYGAFNSVDAAKAACQSEMDERLARWARPAAPAMPLPPSYIDPEHQGDDRELLQVFYGACHAEGGTADEIHLRGIRAVLAARPAAPAAPGPPAEALSARPLLEQVARLGDCIGANTVGQIMAISNRAAAWLRDNPPGRPVAIEPRGCPTPGACSCVEPAAPAAPEVWEAAELGEVTTTERGFELIEFLDYYDKPCSLQQSSLAIYQDPGASAIWLGQGDDRMHLRKDQVEALITHLQRWLDNGSFRAATLLQIGEGEP